jgi:hypothetical protein
VKFAVPSKLKKILEVNFVFSNILVPAAALLLYCGSFAYLSSRFLLEGVSHHFAESLGKYALFITVAAALLFWMILKKNKTASLEFKHAGDRFRLEDLLLLLLPLTPVVQYLLNNQEILSPAEYLYVTAFFLFFSCLYIFVVPAILGRFMPSRALMAVGLAFVFIIANMASMSAYFAWFERGELGIQLMFFGVVFFAAWLLYHFNARWLFHFFIILNFVANVSAQLLAQPVVVEDPAMTFEKNELLALVENKTPVVTPNIYLLIYDAYVSNETMLQYGIDNSHQEDYLREQRFEFYPHTYSIASSTLGTMSTVLNASTEYYGNKRRAVSGDGISHKILRDLGYETYGLFFSDYMFRGYGEHYDHSFPGHNIPPYIQLLKVIFIGEFRFDLGGETVSREQFVEAKQSIFESISGDRVFIYMHTNVPAHSQTSGACLPDEVGLFEKRLETANIEMRQDLDLIIKNDPRAIVVVAGDHGPYLTKNCTATTYVYDISEISRLDIQDRYGTFLAIRWPAGDFAAYDDITVLQDVFPSVFAYMYEDATILESGITPNIPIPNMISEAWVGDGLIKGGINDGQPLFLSEP